MAIVNTFDSILPYDISDRFYPHKWRICCILKYVRVVGYII